MEKIMGYLQRFFNAKKVYLPKIENDDMRLSELYFSDTEIRCKCGCKGVKLNHIFDQKLFKLRKDVGVPMIVNSCCRCEKHNKAVGGNARSLHVYDKPFHPTKGTCAIDIRRGKNDVKILLEAWDSDFSIGVTPTFFHLDARTNVIGLPQVMFAYGNTDMKELEKFKKLVGAK